MTSLRLLRNLVIGFVSLSSAACFLFSFSSSSPLPFGIHPLDEEYFASEVIKCKDGSNFFTRDRINDNFCDCPDGSDEPGTSACPADCCDGSDEYDGSINCLNTCVMGGNIAYRKIQYGATISNQGSIDTKVVLNRLDVADSVQKLKGLKAVIIIQVFFIVVVVGFRIFQRGFRSRRRPSR